MPEDSISDRVTELEARFTQQEDMLDKLSQVIWQQQRDFDALARRLTTLEARLAAMRPAGGSEEPEDPPPHY